MNILLFFSCLFSTIPEEYVLLENRGFYSNFINTEIFMPEEIQADTIFYAFSDSLFIGYETLRDLNPLNELYGCLFDFFYYNFDVIDSRYHYKKLFDNEPPDKVLWDSISRLESRDPCDPVLFHLGIDMLAWWYPCFTGPFAVRDTLYTNYDEYLKRQKSYLRIYDLGNVEMTEGIASKLVLVDRDSEEEFFRHIYMFNTVDNKIKSVVCISRYEITKDYRNNIFFKNTQLTENGAFYIDSGVFDGGKREQWELWNDNEEERRLDPASYFYVGRDGFIYYPRLE